MQQRIINLRQRSALVLLAFLCSLAGPLSAGTLYKWVDEDGKVRYADRLPPQQKKQRHQQLNSQGVVLSTREAAKPPEEMALELEARRKQEELDRLKAIQDQQDRVLLLTFDSETELEHARDNRIEVIDSVIRLIESSIATTQGKLDKLELHAYEAYISKEVEVPGGLQQKIEHFSRKVESRSSQLQAKMEERSKISQKYEHDLERFRDLKSASN